MTYTKHFMSIEKYFRKNTYSRCFNAVSRLRLMFLKQLFLQVVRKKIEKAPTLERASLKLNVLRVFIRLLKDIKAIDIKKYVILESIIDEIGRMLGGWIRSLQ